MFTDRRSFLRTSVLLGGAASAGLPVLPQAKRVIPQQGHELIEQMKWMNGPASFKQNGEELVVRSKPKTDFWRKTYYGYITDNGHFLHLPVSGDFVFEVRINGQYGALYDQAGLMVRLDPENWIKCGTEFFDKRRHASVVFTRDFSDWSTMPDLSETASIWWRALRKKDSIETHCSLEDRKSVV